MAEPTPMMVQYLGIKEQYRDAVLFFRLGDFYEMFNEDAHEISRLLNLTLTKRAGIPMCGIPYHASKVYIARLLRAGKKVAICEQVSQPGTGKGLVERKVVEVITPGTVVEDDYLDRWANNYLAALAVIQTKKGRFFSFSYIDVSTGDFATTHFSVDSPGERLRKELGRIQPSELLLQQSLSDSYSEIDKVLQDYPDLVLNRFPDWSFNASTAYKNLCELFGTENLAAFSLDSTSPELLSAGLIIDYLGQTAGSALTHVSGIHVYSESEYVSIDDATRKNLELMTNLRSGSASYTLFEVMNHTRTAMGTRLLRSWIHHPLVDSKKIEDRLEFVDTLYHNQGVLARVRECLSSILDIERLAGRVAMERAHGKDLNALRQSLEQYLELEKLISEANLTPGCVSPEDRAVAKNTAELIAESIKEDCPIVLNEGGMIRPLWSEKLDELHSLRENSRAVLEEYLEGERTATGIQNLKIRYNRLLGYFLEVSKGNLSAVPNHFIRRRSLANADRFTTDRLVELETELNGLQAKTLDCEQMLFLQVRTRVAQSLKSLFAISREVARVDVFQSLAYTATRNCWVKPIFTEDGILAIVEGRHPVVEAHLPSGEFVPNGITLSCADKTATPSFALITGPNMAGKSTFLRQTALIVLMAQIGSFVPAESVCLTAVDRIFCRVGASDNLARGESTFLVEMSETAHILRTATRNSLVIMDEVGRGTSTEDGLSIAGAVSEYLFSVMGSRTLFATHYHELSRMRHPRLAPFFLDVLETEGKVVFLKKVKPGASNNSYGLHVARLAGVPERVLDRAKNLLETPGSFSPILQNTAEDCAAILPSTPPQLFSEETLVLDEILSVETDCMTPIEALQSIERWKKRLYPSK